MLQKCPQLVEAVCLQRLAVSDALTLQPKADSSDIVRMSARFVYKRSAAHVADSSNIVIALHVSL